MGCSKEEEGGAGLGYMGGGSFSWCFRHGLLDIGAATDNIPAVMQLVQSGCKSPSTVLEHVGFMPTLSQGIINNAALHAKVLFVLTVTVAF